MKVKRIPSKVVEKLQHYVYVYVDHTDNSIFYIGKGVGQRALSHLSDDAENQKVKKIEEIRERGELPRIEILIYGLEGKDQALQIESAVIDALGKKTLTNQVRGWKSRDSGMQSLEDLIVRYGSKAGAYHRASDLD